MKRFDKGYIYSSLLTDFFYSIFLVFVFLGDIFVDDEANSDDIATAVSIFAIACVIIYIGFVRKRHKNNCFS